MRRHGKRLAFCRARFQDGFDDFRDDVARAADEDGVADAHVFARYFVGVVQGGVGDGDAADFHRAQPRHRGNRAGAADLHVDGFHHGGFFHRREFPGNRPAWRARDEARRLLVGVVVGLVHDAVDLVGQRVPLFAEVCHVGNGGGDTGNYGLLRTNG